MRVTAVFVELLIVGLCVLFWIALAATSWPGLHWVSQLAPSLGPAIPLLALLVLGVAYCLGVMFDEIYDSLTHGWECCVARRQLKGSGSKSSICQLVALLDSIPHMLYMRRRIRILRSSMFNAVLITGFSCAVISTRLAVSDGLKVGLIVFILIVGIPASAGFAWAYDHLLRDYWCTLRVLRGNEKLVRDPPCSDLDGLLSLLDEPDP